MLVVNTCITECEIHFPMYLMVIRKVLWTIFVQNHRQTKNTFGRSIMPFILTTCPWRWKNCDPSKHQELHKKQHKVISQKSRIFKYHIYWYIRREFFSLIQYLKNSETCAACDFSWKTEDCEVGYHRAFRDMILKHWFFMFARAKI
jgi:hypothetical protein